MFDASVLMLDDLSDVSSKICSEIASKVVSISRVHQSVEALDLLRKDQFDVFLISMDHSPDWDTLLNQLNAQNSTTPLIYVGVSPLDYEVQQLLRTGLVSDCLDDPLNFDQLWKSLSRTFEGNGRKGAQQMVTGHQRGLVKLIGESAKIQKVIAFILKICDADTTVLIQGESGTGKELIAQALHFEGSRCNGPFVPVNCGAIPSELLESELFGHEKGAFTHAIRTRMGRFELAHGGTVFLDEIAEMSPMLQVKILRVLQERQFERIGGTKTIKSDFRVVAATNRNLEEEVASGRFREDLYYRLNVIPIEAPPLRERVSDIPLLIESFMEKFNRTKRKKIKLITPDSLACLMNYAWPGNVRELENVVERMVILANGDKITVEDIPEKILASQGIRRLDVESINEIPDEGISLNEVVNDYEKRLIVQALDQSNWVKNRAAKLLNVNRTTLLEKMKRYLVTSKEQTP